MGFSKPSIRNKGFCGTGIGVLADYCVISGNNIPWARYAIKLVNAKLNEIVNNSLSWQAGSGTGIAIEDSYYNLIENNSIAGFGSCIQTWYCDDGPSNIIINNRISNPKGYNIKGINMFTCSKNFEVCYNNISGCGIGIRVDQDYNYIHHNLIENGDVGIQLGISSSVSYNNIINNGIGINMSMYWFLADFSQDGIISNNNFILNDLNARFDYLFIFRFNMKFFKNYWGIPRILPYPIFGRIWITDYLKLIMVHFDWFPAKAPYEITTYN